MAECGQCLDLYDQERNAPRICNQCGNTLCERCLSYIYSESCAYKCPYCKTSFKTVWAKNQSLISLLSSGPSNRCQPHNRKAVSLCCSSNCIVSPAICDLAQCSKLHKQKGLNNLPLSFFAETPSDQKDLIAELVIEKLLTQTRNIIESIFVEEKEKFMHKCLQKQQSCSFKRETQEHINQIRQNRFSGISSKNLAEIKRQMMFAEQDQETQMMSQFIQLVQDQKKILINTIICAIDRIEINLFETIVMGKSTTTPNDKTEKCQKRVTPEIVLKKSTSTKQSVNSMETKFQAECDLNRRSAKQLYEDAIKLCYEPKTHLEYELVRQVIGKDFSIKLLFSAAKEPVSSFKQKIAATSNLFIRIELADGKIIGSFFKQNYPATFGQDMFVTDPDAFVYWLNQFRVYRAAKASIAQYDISPDYLFSCGSTYNWDGFWFRKDFLEINQEMPGMSKEIKSSQYVDLNIPLTNRKVLRFEAYQLQFK